MSQLDNVVDLNVVSYEEHVKAACKEHTNFTPEKIEKQGLKVIKVSDISFDYSDMSCQPRIESVNHNTVGVYYNQAVNGFEGNFGIRTPISVAKNPLNGKERYKGCGGHHRFQVALKLGCTYLICKVIDGFFEMTKEDQIDLMMSENAFGDNGMKSDRASLLSNLARTLGSETYMTEERNLIKEYQSLLNNTILLTEEQEDAVLSRIQPLVEHIKSDLRRRINKWSASTLSSSNVSTIATRAYNDWDNQENTKIYNHDKKDAEAALVKYMREYENQNPGLKSKVLSKRFGQTIGNNTVDDRQISGEVGKMLKKHYDEHGEDPEVFFLAVHLSGAPSVRKLLEMRKKFSEDIGEYIKFIRPSLKNFEVIFYGQIKTVEMHEDHESFYSLSDVLEKLEKFN